MISSIISQINVAQPTTDSLATAEGQTEKTLSILELITSGGVGGIIIMTALFVLSIIAVYIFIERFISIKKASCHIFSALTDSESDKRFNFF